jgi:hypothetical protein
VIVLRKKLAEQPVRAAGKGKKLGQACLPCTVVEQVDGDWYEYTVLVTPAMLRQIFYNFCGGTGPLQAEIRPLAAG